MAKPELGIKRICPVTGRKFYDMNKDPIVSPYTGQAYPRAQFEPLLKGPPARARPAAAAAAPAPEEDEAELETAGPELVSLEEVEAGEADKETAGADDVEIAEDAAEEDTFLEPEEEGEDDVAGLIDGEIEDDDEV